MQTRQKFPRYTRLFTRSLSLGLLSLWSDGESIDPRQWTPKRQPFLPYVVFVNHQGRQDGYYDLSGIAWIQNEIQRLQQHNENFFRLVATQFAKRTSALRSTFLREPTLTLPQLRRLTERVRKTWPWFEALWWSIELLEKTDRLDHPALSFLQKARKIGEPMVPGADAVIRKSLQNAFPALGSLTDVVLLSEALQKRIPDTQELHSRQLSYIYAEGKLSTKTSLEQFGRRNHIAFVAQTTGRSQILHGHVAFPGNVQGRVRLVLNRHDVASFRRGEVLVAPSTTPDFLPALKKAVAIVSDEGGIICHAAIIARELKKPCIIGTKNAIDLFHNGDLVAVDATAGTVKILKKKSSTTTT